MPAKRKAPRRGVKCACGCGQAPAETTRLRKASCPDCGYIVRLSRDCISRGLPVCPCGLELEPDCLYDGCAAPGELGAAAYSTLCARETDSAVRADNARRRGLAQMVCPDCSTFRPFGANCDPSAEPDPCPRCASTAPATFPVDHPPREGSRGRDPVLASLPTKVSTMPNPTQLTVDGRETPLQAPQPRQSRPAAPMPLFDAPQTMRGQLNMPTDTEPNR